MADTPKRFAGPLQLAGAAATLYTVPADTTAVLRYMRFTNASGADRTFSVSVGADAAGTRIINTRTVPTNSDYEWTGFIPLAAGEIVQAFASANATVTATICGIEVTDDA